MTDKELEDARRELKTRVSGTRPKEKGKHFEQQVELKGESGRRFRLFKRWNGLVPSIFSVGLTLVDAPGDREVILCRYNGGFHGHRNILERSKFTAQPHIHIARASYIAQGLDPDGYAETTARFTLVDEALRCAVADCNIQDVLPPDEGSDQYTLDLFT